MKTICVTSHFASDVVSLFGKYGGATTLPKDYAGMDIDLAVLCGGSDISPSLYGEDSKGRIYDDNRDSWELEFLNNVTNGKVQVKKILGICRGHQMLNIFFGGSLYYDIYESFGKSHRIAHEIKWDGKNPLDFLDGVNSHHHQAIKNIGNSRKYKVLGTEPETDVIEAIVWDNRFLGVQFHPEFFHDDSTEKQQFSDVIYSWVEGKSNFMPSVNRKNPFRYSDYENKSKYIKSTVDLSQEFQNLSHQVDELRQSTRIWSEGPGLGAWDSSTIDPVLTPTDTPTPFDFTTLVEEEEEDNG